MSACKAPVVAPEIRQLVIKLAHVLRGGASASTAVVGTSLPLTSAENLSPLYLQDRRILQSSSTPVRPTPTVNILEGLITQMIDQFLFMMEYCTDLVLTGQSFFDFKRSLLDNHVENIRRLGELNEPWNTKHV